MKISSCLALLALSSAPVLAAPAALPEHAPGEVMVQMKERTSNLRRDAALARARARILEHVAAPGLGDDGPPGLLRVATDLPVEEAVAALQRDPDVAFAEPNWICRAAAVSNDTYYTGGSQWGAYGNDLPTAFGPSTTTNAFGSQAEKAWGTGQTGSRTIYVGIVDEGVQFAHPDLAANVWTNPYDRADGIDNDRNGYVDDVHGWDFAGSNASVYDGTGDDHGTHVAGTIGAIGGNGAGVAGVCWNVTMIPTKFLGAESGRVSDAVRALNYLVDLKMRHGLNIVASNHSWSTGGYSQSLHDAVIRAAKQGILTIAAAGNSALDNDAAIVYPANFDTTRGTTTQSAATYDGVIAVAALDRYGALATYSDFGLRSVDLGAPGTAIVSTLPDSRYGSYSGTSMATPHVTGAAALIAAARPGILGSELRQAILGSVLPTPSLQGRTATGGRLNLGGVTAVARDVAVVSLSVPTLAVRGGSVTVSAVVANQGTQSETFTVTFTDAPPSGGASGRFTPISQTVTLAPAASRTVAATWYLATASVGTHSVTASASRVNGETDVADNAMSRSSLVTATPAVTGILPSVATGGTTVLVTVYGTLFTPGATLTFTNGSGIAPVASGVVVASNGLRLTAQVRTTADAQRISRTWDVVVTNPGNRIGRKAQAFRVAP